MDDAEGLIPILREGVAVIKMIFFRKLKDHLTERYPDRDPSFTNRLAGVMINDLFGTPNMEEPFVRFVAENRACIDEEMDGLAAAFEEMRGPLTDALRVQFLCDDQEGTGSEAALGRAKDLGVLIVDRDVPLPKNFLALVRELGASFGLIIPPPGADETPGGKGGS